MHLLSLMAPQQPKKETTRVTELTAITRMAAVLYTEITRSSSSIRPTWERGGFQFQGLHGCKVPKKTKNCLRGLRKVYWMFFNQKYTVSPT